MISRFFISRPIFACALSVLVLLAGIVGYVNLPVEQFPDVAPPVVTISTEYTGASAEAVMKSVITPLEEAVNGVEGMEYITSSSTSSGMATINSGTDTRKKPCGGGQGLPASRGAESGRAGGEGGARYAPYHCSGMSRQPLR